MTAFREMANALDKRVSWIKSDFPMEFAIRGRVPVADTGGWE